MQSTRVSTSPRASRLAGALLAIGLLAAPGGSRADGGDFSLDFTASEPDSYDHRLGGGAYNDATVGADTVESLQGGDFSCGELVTQFTAITVEGQTSHPAQAIEIDFSFGAHTTGQPGAAFGDIANVQVNYGPVDNGAGPGGSDAGIQDDGGSLAFLLAESLSGPLFSAGAELLGTVRVDDLEAGEQIVLRTDTRIVCQPGSHPTGNLQSSLVSARVVEPIQDTISSGAQTTSLKKVGDILFPALSVQKTVTTAGGACPGQEILRVASGDAVKYCYEVANFGTRALTNLSALDDNATPDDPSDDFAVVFAGLTDADSDGQADDLAPLATATATALRSIALPVGAQATNRVTAWGDEVAPVWDVATVRVTDLPPGSCSVSVTSSVDGDCPGFEVVNVLEGTPVTWCYEVRNQTAYPLLAVAVSDDGFGAVASLPQVGAGASAGAQLEHVEVADAVHTGSASGTDVFGNPRTCSPDPAAVNVVRPGIQIDKTVRQGGSCPGADSLAVIAGSEVVYCYEVTNGGDTAVASAEVEDDKLGPIGVLGPIPAGGSRMLASAPVEILEDVTNVATVTGRDEHGFPVADQDIAIVDALTADLQTRKQGTSVVNRKLTDIVDYTITVTNLGDIPAEDVVLVDPLPADFVYGSLEPADVCSFDGTSITCEFGTLQPGASASVTLHGTVTIRFGILDNEACASTTSPELELDNNCDRLRTGVAPGETRSAGFYGNHPQATEMCLDASGGVIDLGFVVIEDEIIDDQVDATSGPDLDCEVESGLEMSMGVLNANRSHLNDGTSRSELEQARMGAARQFVVAWCNTTLLGTDGGLDFDAIRAILAGNDVAAINAVQALLNSFNLSGDLLPTALELGPNDSSFPFDDPTDPFDPGDATNPADPRCQPRPLDECGLGFELAFLLPPILWARRRMRG